MSKPKKEDQIKVDWLIPILKKRAVDSQELRHLMYKNGIEKPTFPKMYTLINTISGIEPVYEPSPGLFKILTKEDLEKYEEHKRKSYIGEEY